MAETGGIKEGCRYSYRYHRRLESNYEKEDAKICKRLCFPRYTAHGTTQYFGNFRRRQMEDSASNVILFLYWERVCFFVFVCLFVFHSLETKIIRNVIVSLMKSVIQKQIIQSLLVLSFLWSCEISFPWQCLCNQGQDKAPKVQLLWIWRKT